MAPIVVVVALLCSLLSTTTTHNNDMVELCFNGGPIPSELPAEYAEQIRAMQNKFSEIDSAIAAITVEGTALDALEVKSYFYSLYFGIPGEVSAADFVKTFVATETKTRTVTEVDEAGNTVSREESYTVTVALTDKSVVYANMASQLGQTVEMEEKQNATEVYYRIKYGVAAPTYGTEFDNFIGSLGALDVPFVGLDGFVEPVANWRSCMATVLKSLWS